MNKTNRYLLLSLFVGALLAIMAHLNFELSVRTTPYFSSLWVHLVGFASALLLTPLFRPTLIGKEIRKAPWWSFASGIIGALSVVTINVAIAGPIGLSGALALSLCGQILCGRTIDSFGLFGMERRKLSLTDLVQILLVLSGSLIIIFYAKGN